MKARSGSNNLAHISYEAAYPELELSPRSRNWWAKLKGTPAECIHLDGEHAWMATLLPDTLYLRGKSAKQCARPATWLWLSREQVTSLDEVKRIGEAPGEWFCPEHGAGMLCVAFKRIAEANVFYMNLPYGEAGAYVWI